MNVNYDYIVIGSGSAGSTLAARLAEDSSASVLMLEAGPKDNHLFIRMPAALGFPLTDEKFNWFYSSEPEPHLNNRTIYEARGRVLGGSSSINGMNWVRANPWDYDNWANMGLKGWSYAEVLPYFKRLETFDKGENTYRGGSGPMQIETCAADNPLYSAFLESGQQMGLEWVDDHNGYKQEGVHITQRNVGNGVRFNTHHAYVRKQKSKSNLHVKTGVRVKKVVTENKRAVRVEATTSGGEVTYEASREIILCAGAINSPQILQLSGIGDAEHLKSIGVPVVHNLPAVGKGMKDHVAAPVMFRETKGVSPAGRLSSLFGKAKLGAEWLFLKQGIGATNFFEVGAFMRIREEEIIPDVQFEFVPMLGEMQHGDVKLDNGFQYFFSLMRPKSEGRVWIDSPDPMTDPKFVFNFFEHRDDLDLAIAATKAIRKTIYQKAWDNLRGEEVTPGADIRTDSEIEAWLRDTAGTNYHPCCTCRMGAGEGSVVDNMGRVHGIQGLRVVDASIMPEIVSGNLNAPVIMMAERISDDILGRTPLPPENADYYLAH